MSKRILPGRCSVKSKTRLRDRAAAEWYARHRTRMGVIAGVYVPPLRVYHCHVCDAWHLTSKGRGETVDDQYADTATAKPRRPKPIPDRHYRTGPDR